MEEEIKAKKITRKEKVKLISTRDVITKNFPQAKVILSNIWGEMVVTEIELTLRTPNDYNNMPFFYERLLPLLIPLQEKNEEKEKELEKEKEKKINYFG
jgi:hypothetical protein